MDGKGSRVVPLIHADVPVAQKMNLSDFDELFIYPQAPPSSQNFHSCFGL